MDFQRSRIYRRLLSQPKANKSSEVRENLPLITPFSISKTRSRRWAAQRRWRKPRENVLSSNIRCIHRSTDDLRECYPTSPGTGQITAEVGGSIWRVHIQCGQEGGALQFVLGAGNREEGVKKIILLSFRGTFQVEDLVGFNMNSSDWNA